MEAPTTALVLAYPDFRMPLIVAIKASSREIGEVWPQKDDNRTELPIHIASLRLNHAEMNYSTYERDRLVYFRTQEVSALPFVPSLQIVHGPWNLEVRHQHTRPARKDREVDESVCWIWLWGGVFARILERKRRSLVVVFYGSRCDLKYRLRTRLEFGCWLICYRNFYYRIT